jgi:hypothetical protein
MSAKRIRVEVDGSIPADAFRLFRIAAGVWRSNGFLNRGPANLRGVELVLFVTVAFSKATHGRAVTGSA